MDTTEAGIYKIAENAGNFVLHSSLMAVNMVVAPRFADLYAGGKREQLQGDRNNGNQFYIIRFYSRNIFYYLFWILDIVIVRKRLRSRLCCACCDLRSAT